jgi:hypothetical protein
MRHAQIEIALLLSEELGEEIGAGWLLGVALAALRLWNAPQDDLNVIAATAPGCFSALSTCCSTAHNLYRALISELNRGQISLSRSNDPALARLLALNQCGYRSLTRLVFCRYDR